MAKIVIEINGVRHALVPDGEAWFDCCQCSLADICRVKEALLCNVFDSPYYHFAISKD